jgi:hypothetical protein
MRGVLIGRNPNAKSIFVIAGLFGSVVGALNI